MARPEARDRRHVMRIDGSQRQLGIGGLRLEAAAVLALEVEHLRREDAPASHRRRHLRWHDAEVFSDDDRVMALALEREDAKEVFSRVLHVRAFLSARALRNPEEPEQ